MNVRIEAKMTVAVKAGAKLKSAVCETQLVVVKASAGEYDLRCGGAPMLAGAAVTPAGVALDPFSPGAP